jgi:hypothetical protein
MAKKTKKAARKAKKLAKTVPKAKRALYQSEKTGKLYSVVDR